jgi:hypothetical protein
MEKNSPSMSIAVFFMEKKSKKPTTSRQSWVVGGMYPPTGVAVSMEEGYAAHAP